jgi:hypothetical protein
MIGRVQGLDFELDPGVSERTRPALTVDFAGKDFHPTRRDEMTDRQSMLDSYLRRRAAGTRVSDRLVKSLSAKTIRHAASELGLMHKNVIVLDSEAQEYILMDFAIHSCRVEGETAAQLYYDTAGPHTAEDRETLESMMKGYYTFVSVLKADPGLGITAWDVFREEQIDIVDIGLSYSSRINQVFASRLFPFDEYRITAGAMIPITTKSVITIADRLVHTFGRDYDPAFNTPAQEKELAKIVIRTFFNSPGNTKVMYKSIGTSPKEYFDLMSKTERSFHDVVDQEEPFVLAGIDRFDERATSEPESGRVVIDEKSSRRSDRASKRCYCGSRKKYSACCGRR